MGRSRTTPPPPPIIHLCVLTKVSRCPQAPWKTFLDQSLGGREVSSRLGLRLNLLLQEAWGAGFPQPFPPTHRQAGLLPALSPSSAGGSPGLRDTKEWAAGRAREARRLEESAAAWGRGLPE